MSYFLSDRPLNAGSVVELTDSEAGHIILSRRIRTGEIIEIQGPDEKRFEVEVVKIGKGALSVRPIREISVPKESSLSITIFQSLIKEQPLDFIIQKATELGVDSLVLFHSRNSVERFKNMDKKLARWIKISEEAAKQSGRVKPISIVFLDKTEKVSEQAKELDHIFLLEPTSKTNLPTWKLSFQVGKIGILIGPEGGFTTDEVAEFSKIKNLTAVSMGPRTLRADTAAIASAAIAQALWGDL